MTATLTEQTAVFGWQGLSITVPASWEPAALDGDWSRGYARLDDMDAIRLELKWNRLKGDVDAANVRDTLLRTLTRRKGGRSAPVEAKALAALADVPNASFFQWQGEVTAVGVVIQCRRCARAVLAQLIYPKGKESRAESAGVLGSLREHADGARSLWSLYRFRADVAESWKLTWWQLAPGYLELAFDRGRGEKLRLRRWGPEEMILASCDFDAWHKRVVLCDAGGAVETERDEVAGHAGVRMRRDLSGRPVRRCLARATPPRAAWTRWNLDSLAWQCGASNRLYAWDYASRRARGRDRDWHIVCHGEHRP